MPILRLQTTRKTWLKFLDISGTSSISALPAALLYFLITPGQRDMQRIHAKQGCMTIFKPNPMRSGLWLSSPIGALPCTRTSRYAEVTNLDWQSSTKLLIHIGDAQCPGARYTSILDRWRWDDTPGATPQVRLSSKSHLYGNILPFLPGRLRQSGWSAAWGIAMRGCSSV